MTIWQPIKTVPKRHGGHFLMFGSGPGFHECVFIGAWWEEHKGHGHWTEAFGNDAASPTHWSPIPQPPPKDPIA